MKFEKIGLNKFQKSGLTPSQMANITGGIASKLYPSGDKDDRSVTCTGNNYDYTEIRYNPDGSVKSTETWEKTAYEVGYGPRPM